MKIGGIEVILPPAVEFPMTVAHETPSSRFGWSQKTPPLTSSLISMPKGSEIQVHSDLHALANSRNVEIATSGVSRSLIEFTSSPSRRVLSAGRTLTISRITQKVGQVRYEGEGEPPFCYKFITWLEVVGADGINSFRFEKCDKGPTIGEFVKALESINATIRFPQPMEIE